MVAMEAIHSMDNSKERAMFMNINMAKAYDQVSWEFLHKILLAFGFAKEWVNWILSCVISSSFSVLVNGEPSDLFSAFEEFSKGTLYLLIYSLLWQKVLEDLLSLKWSGVLFKVGDGTTLSLHILTFNLWMIQR